MFKDSADILKEAGAEALSNSVKSVMIDAEYLTAKSKSKFLSRPDDTQGIAKAITFLVPFFQSIEGETEKDAFSRNVATAFGVEPSAVLYDLKFGQEKTAASRRDGPVNRKARTITMNDELYLLTAVAVNCETRPDSPRR